MIGNREAELSLQRKRWRVLQLYLAERQPPDGEQMIRHGRFQSERKAKSAAGGQYE
ncbi:hypothetical protein SDC9_63548 [bioreactor metagenome]|uniref:Uncharacterized protein n=1 Tax=bioreactor metagenome TaxID=1076179 RepID=A0A644XLU5_9ZZZZ